MKAMLFAAGLGTRLRPLTDTMPKALVPVGGCPLLDITVRNLISFGVNHIVVNVHHFSQQIIDYLEEHNYGISISVSDESCDLLDTGGGLLKASSLFNLRSVAHERLLVHNVDILSNADLSWLHSRHPEADVLLLVSKRKTSRFLLFDDDMHLVGWTNVSTGEVRSPHADIDPALCRQYAFSGIHCFGVHLFDDMRNNGFSDKFSIIDYYLDACVRFDIRGVVSENLELLDVGKQSSIAVAETFLQRLSQKIDKADNMLSCTKGR